MCHFLKIMTINLGLLTTLTELINRCTHFVYGTLSNRDNLGIKDSYRPWVTHCMELDLSNKTSSEFWTHFQSLG